VIGVISSRGGTNFAHDDWKGFDFRTALEDELGLPVVYNNDGNAAALYAHHAHFGAIAG
jgi:predicted NBD/HSP70 family sugar kinase